MLSIVVDEVTSVVYSKLIVTWLCQVLWHLLKLQGIGFQRICSQWIQQCLENCNDNHLISEFKYQMISWKGPLWQWWCNQIR